MHLNPCIFDALFYANYIAFVPFLPMLYDFCVFEYSGQFPIENFHRVCYRISISSATGPLWSIWARSTITPTDTVRRRREALFWPCERTITAHLADLVDTASHYCHFRTVLLRFRVVLGPTPN